MSGSSAEMPWRHAMGVVASALLVTAIATGAALVAVFLLGLAGSNGGSESEAWDAIGIAILLALAASLGVWMFGGAFAVRQVMSQLRSRYEITFRDAIRVPLTALAGPIVTAAGYGVVGSPDEAANAVAFIVALASIVPAGAFALRRRAYPRLVDPPPPVDLSSATYEQV